ALKAHRLAGRVVGCDREDVLEQALSAGAIGQAQPDMAAACAGSDLVVLALPVGGIIDAIARIAKVISKKTLVTDVGSTKREICAAAERAWGGEAAQRFLPGHPMAGKAEGGIGHASAELFQGAPWLFTPWSSGTPSGAATDFMDSVRTFGARPVLCTAEEHDRVCAYVSHLPQMLSTALANVVDENGEEGIDGKHLAGAGLRSMTRLAASPYAMWRDIALTNSDNLAAALLQMEQKLAHIRENLKSPELRAEFERAQAARAVLK
ncbi:MAG: prephenate dehydrogenase, partial [Terriglobales bacterium]